MRKFFLLITLLPAIALAKPINLQQATIQSIHDAMKKHTLTCEALIQQNLNFIKRYDLALNRGAPINAFAASLSFFPDFSATNFTSSGFSLSFITGEPLI